MTFSPLQPWRQVVPEQVRKTSGPAVVPLSGLVFRRMPKLETFASEGHENGVGTGCRVGVGVFFRGGCVAFSLPLGKKIVKSRSVLCRVSFLKPYGMLDCSRASVLLRWLPLAHRGAASTLLIPFGVWSLVLGIQRLKKVRQN